MLFPLPGPACWSKLPSSPSRGALSKVCQQQTSYCLQNCCRGVPGSLQECRNDKGQGSLTKLSISQRCEEAFRSQLDRALNSLNQV